MFYLKLLFNFCYILTTFFFVFIHFFICITKPLINRFFISIFINVETYASRY